MKTYLIILFLSAIAQTLIAQDVNFRTLENTKHIIGMHIGADHGSYYGLSYGYKKETKYRPIVIGTEILLPFGSDVADDWKWKISAQTEIIKEGNFSVILKPSGVVRRYESTLARMYNFGMDLSVNFGYATPEWSVMGVAVYDKAIATHLKHNLLKEYYPGIQDGWSVPTGGNFKFGVRSQVSMGSWSTFLTVGKQFGQDFRDNPALPFFAELSLQKRFTK